MRFFQKRKIFQILFVLILLTACKKEEPVISVHSIHEVQATVDEILKTQRAEDVLVVFDIDMTLTQPDHPATYYPSIIKFRSIIKNIFASLTPTQRDIALTLTTKLPQRLIEKDSPKVIKNMQAKGVQVIALTASLSGHRDDHRNKTIFKRRDALQKKGFNFSFQGMVRVHNGCHWSRIAFEKYADSYPMFYHGILCTNGENNGIGKGKVLEAFLSECSPGICDHKSHILFSKDKQVEAHRCKAPNVYEPKVIIMVDDKKANIVDAKNVLATSHPNILFVGIEYQGAFDYAPKDISEADFIKFWQGLADQAKKICSK
jgi:hypothetical protein